MAKKRRGVSKPATSNVQTEIQSPELPSIHGDSVAPTEVFLDPCEEFDLEGKASDGIAEVARQSPKAVWADEVEESDFQTSAKEIWSIFHTNHEIEVESSFWKSSIVCIVLGANPPFRVFEGFIKRIWENLGIEKIVRMHSGFTLVSFRDEATSDIILETVVIHFDKKPVVLRPWTADLDTAQMVKSVSVWVRLNGLGLQYWGKKNLSALLSTIGKLIMVDKVMLERSMIKFARVLVDVEVSDNPPKSISFVNERKQIIKQQAMADAKNESQQIAAREDSNVDPYPESAEIVRENTKDELRSSGTYYTWSNKHDMGVRIFSKLDRVFTNESWLDIYPNTAATFKWDTISNHCFCLVKFLKASNYGTRPFRFCNYWSLKKDFKVTDLAAWRDSKQATLMNITQKLFRVKHPLKRWSKTEMSPLMLYNVAKDVYNNAQEAFATNPTCDILMQAEKDMYQEFVIARKQTENKIVSFWNDDTIVEEYPLVVEHFLQHFHSFIGKKSSATIRIDIFSLENSHKLNLEEQIKLIRPFNKSDIKKALFSINSTKSPGPDGFGSRFFNSLWDSIGEDITKNRLLAHNILIFQDMLKGYTRKNISARCFFKIDISKAYDTVDWGFIADLLKGNESSVEHVYEAFKVFSDSTGLKANDDKSLAYFGGVDNEPTKWRALDCVVIFDKIYKKLNSWSSRNLSFAGRAQLIHSILLGIRNYWMSLFILPQKIIAAIEKCCTDFLWGLKGNRSKYHLSSWERVCLPKKQGGLGFHEGKKWNITLMAKFIWAISKKQDNLWVHWVNSTYLKGQDFWQLQFKNDASWYFKKLLRLRNVIDKEEVLKAEQFYNQLVSVQEVDYNARVLHKMVIPKYRFICWQ
uniref:DUF4283 domain-containing protein n=1 Tax=Cannabis sativa TaxID=3483 RepID=A0A803NJE0_CANSA